MQLAVRNLDFLHQSILRHLCGLHTGMQGRPLPAKEVLDRQHYANMRWLSFGQRNTSLTCTAAFVDLRHQVARRNGFTITHVWRIADEAMELLWHDLYNVQYADAWDYD